MGINLGGVEAWSASDEVPPGAYVAKPTNVERGQSKSNAKNEQITVDWRVIAGPFTGAEKRDWVTLTENSMGRIVQLIEACGHEVPTEDFKDYGELADWIAEKVLKDAAVTTEIVVREEPWTDKEGKERQGTKVKGYRRPGPGSDVPNDASGFQSGPNVSGQCSVDGCDQDAVKDGLCKKHEVPF
jgi:hypothetical protein